ncbi:hypothetical protein ABIC20_000856 [Methylobacterium radiotolerans]|uniref:Protein translocase subunit SecA n=1 Tax=Methylobacterium radiotolerans TaxID=31998 RepID=A0ABV2NAP0_9HYPH
MLGSIAKKIFGSSNDRRVKGYRPRVAQINALEPEIQALSDEALRARTDMLKAELANGKSLDDILVPAFATVREAAKRVFGQRHFDVQLIGGMVLHEGGIAEMKTGEGKTLVATLPVYLNALEGKGVHVVTVNDYLASRDAEWMGQVYRFLGLSVGTIVHGLDDAQRKEAYACDITYGTNNEYGFDYLRDNMKYELSQLAQRGHNFAIVDEVDSILIDEARTPLIISGPVDDRSELYVAVDALMPRLRKEFYDLDEKQRTVSLTEEGNEFIEEAMREAGLLKEGDLYDAHNVTLVHHVNQALRAHTLFTRDKDYIVKNDEVVIIDEFTGRMMQGRRYSEGLHQALEAKERVTIQPENQTLASITFQNYFRLYKKLAGMTGTASTGGRRVRRDLQARRGRHPDQQGGRARRRGRRGLPDRRREVRGHHRRDRQGACAPPADPGRHRLDREVGAPRRDAQEGRLQPARLLRPERPDRRLRRRPRGPGDQALRRAERPLPRAGGLHRGRGGRAGRDHHRHQHGRTRHRHQTRRQPRDAHREGAGPSRRRSGARRPRSRRSRPRSPRTGPRCWPRASRPIRRRAGRRTCRAASTSSAPSATNRGASTTSSAAAPGVRAIPAARSSTCRFRMT